ncbi:bifunctional pantoate--beta-alanine ligase/(d)CMP kinase [Synechococcales cyanobacterium C]|uniref:Bifunctional pantoate ligase/cytidylate kinase n=1 Tax=Petrachloros mirabilis ULC683 TaxID=2781853 RepID=A0A8K2A261_9CYAN|nr:bifunctional pantoate--beta-alanine ligase/(d)CMP kinase [Petrachloros mirabilis]NCJ08363.1 bifunctional pantoate--beta-alanine ligase/(d)CMP kinase [Petrachloros mirabilis ULC683]
MSDVVVIKTIPGMRRWVQQVRTQPSPHTATPRLGRIGLVPTMGFLHPGHQRLIQQARQENDTVVVSVFVNPLQFGAGEDFQSYPRTLDQDCQICQTEGVDVVFAPEPQTLLNQESLTQVVPPDSLTGTLCGQTRPEHFQGVATIVVKLLNLIQPERIYFGQKDAQQLAIVRRLVQDLNVPVQVVACPIVREANGLAYSSRNQYLTPGQQQDATALSQGLLSAKELFRSGVRQRDALIQAVAAQIESRSSLKLEYVDLVDPDTLVPLDPLETTGLLAVAAWVGEARLIDNVKLNARLPILAIDGPAGAGKSTITQCCAQELGLQYLDTGAMYRAVTWLVLQAGLPLTDEVAIAELVGQSQLTFLPSSTSQAPSQVWINGQAVTQAIRSRDVTAQVSAIAAQPSVREILVQQQRQLGAGGGVAMEGRDIGTHVFPDAEVKIFLTASIQERARRRQRDLDGLGEAQISLEQLEQEIAARDQYDSQRSLAPLCKAMDAIEIETDHLTIDQVTAKVVSLYRAQQSQGITQP